MGLVRSHVTHYIQELCNLLWHYCTGKGSGVVCRCVKDWCSRCGEVFNQHVVHWLSWEVVTLSCSSLKVTTTPAGNLTARVNSLCPEEVWARQAIVRAQRSLWEGIDGISPLMMQRTQLCKCSPLNVQFLKMWQLTSSSWYSYFFETYFMVYLKLTESEARQ